MPVTTSIMQAELPPALSRYPAAVSGEALRRATSLSWYNVQLFGTGSIERLQSTLYGPHAM